MKIESREMYRVIPHDNVVGKTKVITGGELIEMIYQSGDYEDMWQLSATELYGEEEDFVKEMIELDIIDEYDIY